MKILGQSYLNRFHTIQSNQTTNRLNHKESDKLIKEDQSKIDDSENCIQANELTLSEKLHLNTELISGSNQNEDNLEINDEMKTQIDMKIDQIIGLFK